MINGDDAIRMYNIAALGLPIDMTGLPLTPENIDFFLKVQAECENAPDGVMLSVPNEWADSRYNDIIAASDKAHGGPNIDGAKQAVKFVESEKLSMYKEARVGSMVSWNSSGGTAKGKIERIIRDGKYDVPDSDVTVTGTEEEPAAVIRIYRNGKATDTLVAHKLATLNL